ncbi:hypothetical protein PAXRUDRAFT_825152 [Paxillus rubicundulus Ve08.2h10]|uniref:DUF6534 domain-containing protein n=1 Tax=Paxillus rubicundulus Ve08.2h10 TaxID=930991 RepID=A0A0D0DGU1_9AGAM|nr:hypothetical protein PAXRUDRAFT_825152 [Paxillus rubicundulus Ve08.2h10]
MGVLAVQSFVYFTRFADDRKAVKALVMVILFLETLITIFAFHGFWITSTYFVDEYPGVPTLTLSQSLWSFFALGPITGLVTTLTQGFFCWRISIIRQSLLIPIGVMSLSLLQLASIIYLDMTTALFPVNTGSAYTSSGFVLYPNISPFLVTWLGSSLICDLAITICMTLSLRTSKQRLQNNKPSLAKLTRMTIETGLVTTLAALLELIIGTVFSETMYHIAVFYLISKLYANCLLASLNFRLILRSPYNRQTMVIVWNDPTSDSQPRLPRSRAAHAMQFLANPQADVELVADPADPQKNHLGSEIYA